MRILIKTAKAVKIAIKPSIPLSKNAVDIIVSEMRRKIISSIFETIKLPLNKGLRKS